MNTTIDYKNLHKEFCFLKKVCKFNLKLCIVLKN